VCEMIHYKDTEGQQLMCPGRPLHSRHGAKPFACSPSFNRPNSLGEVKGD
jgi:hypothetical protein